jgi:hypothetical protein
MQRRTSVEHRHTTPQPGGAVQSNGAHVLLVKVTMHLEQAFLAVQSRTERLMQRRELRAANVHDRAVDLCDGADRLRRWGGIGRCGFRGYHDWSTSAGACQPPHRFALAGAGIEYVSDVVCARIDQPAAARLICIKRRCQ